VADASHLVPRSWWISSLGIHDTPHSSPSQTRQLTPPPCPCETMTPQQQMGVLRCQLKAHMSRSGLFARGILASLEPGANVRVSLLIANGWRPDGWWREVGSDTPDLSRVPTRVLAMVPPSCPVERILVTTKEHSLKSAESDVTRYCASADVCALKSQASGA
jgi:hypothetical protein